MAKEKNSKYPPEELEREGRMVREAIKASGVRISQEKCMGMLGIAQANMSQWLNGSERMSDYNLVFLGNVYGFDVIPIRESLKLYREYFIKQALRDGIKAYEGQILADMAASVSSPALPRPATANQIVGTSKAKPKKSVNKSAAR